MAAVDLGGFSKLIVGEGKSDKHFFESFCIRNGIEKFSYDCASVENQGKLVEGFSAFRPYLVAREATAEFKNLTDLILVIDSTDHPMRRLGELRNQIKKANIAIGRKAYSETIAANEIASSGQPRVHVLQLPIGGKGGLESVCFDVARDHCETTHGKGKEIEGWVDKFADEACKKWKSDKPWSTEKRDKLRLQTFISASWGRNPQTQFSRLFRDTNEKIVPLTSKAFKDLSDFLKKVEAL